jgi:hypothetical protein
MHFASFRLTAKHLAMRLDSDLLHSTIHNHINDDWHGNSD